jgi:hypothetical protein
MRWTLAAAACAAAGAAALAAEGGIRLATPVEVLAGGAPIDPEVGHATPNLVDWDGDGKRDLLVGQFGGGRLRVYLNSGTDADPKFRDFRFAKAGGKDASVPVA